MNKAQTDWLKCYCDSGNGVACVAEHYPDVAKKNQSAKSAQLKRKLAPNIVNALQVTLSANAPKMLDVLKRIALNDIGTDVRPSERLKAASEWLTRSGLDAATVIEVKDTRTHAEMIKQVKDLAQRLPKNIVSELIPNNLLEHKDETTH